MHQHFYKIVTAVWIAAGLALLGNWPAAAADLPKIITKGPAYPIDASGWYAGVHTAAAVAQADVSSGSLFATSLVQGKLVAAGGEVGGVIGLIRGSVDQDRWWGLRATVSYENISASLPGVPGSGNNLSLVSRWSATQVVEFSVTWLQNLMSALPNLGLNGIVQSFPGFTPIAPPGVRVAAPHQFFAVGVREFGLSGTIGGSSGSSWAVAPQIETGYLWQVLNTATGKPTGGAVRAYAFVAFPTRGFTINNAFGTGAPVTGAGASMGKIYGMALNYEFGL